MSDVNPFDGSENRTASLIDTPRRRLRVPARVVVSINHDRALFIREVLDAVPSLKTPAQVIRAALDAAEGVWRAKRLRDTAEAKEAAADGDVGSAGGSGGVPVEHGE